MNWWLAGVSWAVAAYFGVGFVVKAGLPPKTDLLIGDALFVALTLFFLFLPFFNKIKVGSWLELERQVKEAKKETTAAKEELREFKTEVRNTLSVVTTTLNTQISSTNVIVNNTPPDPATLREQQQKIEKKFHTTNYDEIMAKYEVGLKSDVEEDYAYILAKVRIDIERLLRAILGKRTVASLAQGSSVVRLASARQLFNEVVQMDIEYESLRQAFEYVNRVCNAAIHGQVVSKEQTDEATKLGAQIVDVLSLHPNVKD